MESVDISVVIATYKRPKLLNKCLSALANQTYFRQHFEVIVVSDGPDPKTQEVIAYWQNSDLLQLKFFILKRKSGPATARNRGWQMATGKLIAFTDDDCLPYPEWLAQLWINYISNDHSYTVLTGKVIVPTRQRDLMTDHEYNTSQLSEAAFITANCACSQPVLSLTGGFDERYTMAYREDSDFEFNIISRGIKIKRVEAAVVEHPVRQARWGNSLKEQKKSRFNALLYKKYPRLYSHRICQSPPLKYYLAVGSLLLAFIYILYGAYNAAFVHILFWTILWLELSYQRLKKTSKQPDHIFEMLCTSAVIPFLSVYWHCYGLLKYRTVFF